MTEPAEAKIRIFISYARKDREFLDRLLTHLAALENEGIIEHWTDLALDPGDSFDGFIARELDRADIVLLLVSADFLASHYIRTVELAHALDRAQSGRVAVIPAILKPCDWQESAIRGLQALPSGSRPITKWGNRDDAFLDIAKGVRSVALHLRNDPLRVPAGPKSAAQTHERVLDAAIARHIPLGKPSDLTLMVREPASAGLKAILGLDDEYSASPEDIRSKPFQMDFPRDSRGDLQTATLSVAIEAPDFEPASQTAHIAVPPHGDSAPYPFLLTPLFQGELVINIRVFSADGRQIARILRIVAEASDRIVAQGRVLAAIPLAAFPTTASVAAAPAGPLPTVSYRPALEPRSSFPFPAVAGTVAAIAVIVFIALFYADSGHSGYQRPDWAYRPPVAAPPEFKLPPPLNLPPLSHTWDAASEISKALNPPSVQPVPGLKPPPTLSANLYPFLRDYNAASNLAKKGDIRGASFFYSQALREATGDIAPFESLALRGYATNQLALADTVPPERRDEYLKSAAASAVRAAELEPNSAPTRYLAAVALDRAGRLPEAEAAYRKTTDIDPTHARAWYGLGLILSKEKRVDDAAVALKQALKFDPTNADARLQLAANLLEKDPFEARKQLNALQGSNITGSRLTALNRMTQELAKTPAQRPN